MRAVRPAGDALDPDLKKEAKEDAEAASAANAVWMASMQERAAETGQAVKDEQDNLAAREAHFAKKWEGDPLLARALARRRGGS